ncbi:hypothetical protein V2J09_009025 [Rumex salicifolius]
MMIVSDVVRVLTSSRVAPKNEETVKELEKKHPHTLCPIMVPFWDKVEVFSSSKDVVLSRIKSFPKGTSCGRDGVWAQPLVDALWKAAIVVANDLVSSITVVVNLLLAGKCPSALGEFIASSRPIVVGTVWQRLVSKVAALVVRNEFGVGVTNRGEAINHVVNRLIETLRGAHNMSMLMVDFSNDFNLIDRSTMLSEVRHRCPSLSLWVEFCYARPARLYYDEAIWLSCQGVQQCDSFGPLLFALTLHPLVHQINEDCNLDFMALYLDEELNRRHCMMIVSDGHFTVVVRVFTLSRVASKNEEILK